MKCTQSKILKHLALFGYGDGSGSGYGSGNGYGYGDGNGSGYGNGYGSGYGNGYGSGEKDPAKAGAVVVEK